MDSKRPIDVGLSSALIDLKAELLKKQGELQSSKSRQQGVQKSLKKSELLKAKSVYASKNKGIESRSEKDLEELAEVEKTVEKSRSILEAKAKLYERMTSEALEHDEHEHPVLSQSLVNFTQKAIDQIKESREQAEQIQRNRSDGATKTTSETDQEYQSVNKEYEYSVNEDEWTEFTDALGRTRRCLKSDLPSFISRDAAELARPQNPSGVSLSKEAEEHYIEMKRQKWEQEAEETAVKEKVHYQDVLYDEVRSHGVGYYGFSKNATAREEQLKELKKFSEQTTATREKVLKERSKKKSLLEERLKKIKAKKRAKLGLPPEPDETNEDSEDEHDDDDGSSRGNKDGPQGVKRDRVEDLDPLSVLSSSEVEEQKKEMRPWDYGKPGVFGPRPTTFDELDEKWLRDRRSDREKEFAPPTSYYSQGGLKRAFGGGSNTRKEASSTATSSSSSGSRGGESDPSFSKYSNFFVKSKDHLPSATITRPYEPSEPTESIGPEPPSSYGGMKAFRPPDQFWKGKSSAVGSSSKPSSGYGHGQGHGAALSQMQKPIPIVDELAAPVAESSDEFERGRGTEIAPPPTFDYYHGETSRGSRGRGKPGSGKSDEVVADAVSSGLKALRERFEAEQKAKAMKD